MADKKTLPVEEFIELLLQLERKGAEVTVSVARPGAVGVAYLRIERGQVVDLVRTTPPSLLASALGNYPGLRDRDRRRVQKQADTEQRDLGEILLESRLIPDGEIPALVLAEVERQFADLLRGGPSEVQTVPPVQSTGRWRSIGDYFHLAVPVSNLLVQAARQLGSWQLVRPHLPLLKEVFYATPQSLQVLEREAERPTDAALVRACDGRLDLGTVIERAGGDPFAHLVVVERLQKAGCLAAVSAVQLFQLACEADKERDLPRARRLFERAEERGLDDFDLGFRLGEVYSALGLTERAIDRFLAFAEKCVGQFRIEDTIRACRRVIQIDPTNLPIYERYVSLLARYGKGDEALAEAMALVRRFQTDGDVERARATLEKVLEHASANEEVLRTYRTLCQESGHAEGARRALAGLAELRYQRGEQSAARELYQELFIEGEDSATVRVRLAELHLVAGHVEKANEHLLALQQYSGWAPQGPSAAAREFIRRMLTLDQRNPALTQWLLEDARTRQDPLDLLRILKLHCARLQALERFEEARAAAEEVTRLAPDDAVAVRRLAELERRCGHPGRAVSVLEELALSLRRAGAEEELARVVEQVLAANPLSLVAREIWQENLASAAELPVRVKRRAEGQLLDLARGVLDGYPPPRATGGTVERALGMLALHLADLSGHAPHAVEIAVWLARSCADQRDLGTLQEAILRLEKLAPDHAVLPELRQSLAQSTPEASFAGSDGPLVTKVSVSGITARLKGLRGGTPGSASEPPPAIAEVPRASAEPIPMAPKASPPAVTTAAFAAAHDADLPDPAPPKGAKIGGALSRLKALKGGAPGEGPTVPVLAGKTAEEPHAEPAPLPPPSAETAGIKGSLARLRNMKNKAPQEAVPGATGQVDGKTGGKTQPPDEKTVAAASPGSAPAAPAIPARTGASAPPTADPQDGQLPPPKPVKELGSAASRLNSLRNKATS